METLGLLGASAALFGAGLAMVLYEFSRIKAGRSILKGRDVVQRYYMTYLLLFVLALTAALRRSLDRS